VAWSNFGNPFLHLNPVRPFVLRYYGRIMDDFIKQALNARFEELKSARNSETTKSKSVIALALSDYLKQLQSRNDAEGVLDPSFIEHATRQMRVFLFAGHDTTTSILVYTYHMLAKHPKIAQKVRDEHSAIIDPDPQNVAERLRDNPTVLNQIPYTIAVIKETMRLYPPAGNERAGMVGMDLVDRHGTRYPSEGCYVSTQHYGLHHHPKYWPRVDEFLPERWLVAEGHELYPVTGAYRPFEHGPRNCIGQNLAMLELRVVLALTIRRFKILPAYDEWDSLTTKGWLESAGFVQKPVQLFEGERVYSIEKGAGHPKQGYPCKVTVL
jgi:cytochrome P450